MKVPRWAFGSATAFGSFLVIGGFTDIAGTVPTGTIEAYSVSNDTVLENVSFFRAWIARTQKPNRPHCGSRLISTYPCDNLTQLRILQYTLSAPRAYPLVLASANRVIVAGGLTGCCQLGNIDM
jgi:hypothetical protein